MFIFKLKKIKKSNVESKSIEQRRERLKGELNGRPFEDVNSV